MIVFSISKYSPLFASIMATPLSLPGFEDSRSPDRRLKCETAPLAAAQKFERPHV